MDGEGEGGREGERRFSGLWWHAAASAVWPWTSPSPPTNSPSFHYFSFLVGMKLADSVISIISTVSHQRDIRCYHRYLSYHRSFRFLSHYHLHCLHHLNQRHYLHHHRIAPAPGVLVFLDLCFSQMVSTSTISFSGKLHGNSNCFGGKHHPWLIFCSPMTWMRLFSRVASTKPLNCVSDFYHVGFPSPGQALTSKYIEEAEWCAANSTAAQVFWCVPCS